MFLKLLMMLFTFRKNLKKIFTKPGAPAKVFLHIGTHKTGTSSIQRFLTINRKALRKQGFFYPEFFGPSSHFFALHFGFGTPKKVIETNQQWSLEEQKTLIHERMTSQVKKNEHIILSSEILASVRPAEGYKMRAAIKDFFPSRQVKVICYLRRQDHYLESSYNQKLKTGRFSGTIKQHVQNTNCDWHWLLTTYAEIFGKGNIIVRVFEKAAFTDQDILHDFLVILGIPSFNGFVFPHEKVNVRFKHEVIEMITLCRDSVALGLNKLFQEVKPVPFTSYPLLSPAERIEILAHYEASNRQVAREFLNKPEGRLFSEPWPEPDEPWEPQNKLTLEKSIPVLMGLLEHQQNKLYELNNTFQKLNKPGTK